MMGNYGYKHTLRIRRSKTYYSFDINMVKRRCINVMVYVHYLSCYACHKWHFRKKKVTEQEICVFYFLYDIFLKHFIFEEEFSEVLSYVYRVLHVNCPLLLSDFNVTNFHERFLKNSQIPNFMKNRPVGAELFHAGGRI
jgi:hypothetical protein